MAIVSLSLGACDSAEEKECKGLVSDAETRLLSMNAYDEESVEFTLTGLRTAQAACQKAQLAGQVKDIEEAIQNTSRHLERLESGEIKPPPPPPTPEELERLAKEGDPSCPLGQGYQHPLLKKLIRCTGPRMVEMTRDEALAYFSKFKFAAATKENRVRALRDSLSYEYVFVEAQGMDLPACLTIEAPTSRDAVELLSFATNLPVETLKLADSITIDGQELPLAAGEKKDDEATQENGAMHHLVLGDCAAQEPMMKRTGPPSSSEESTDPSVKEPAALP